MRARWSPTAWDAEHTVDSSAVEQLVEAARWSPSAGNSQPWSFAIAVRGDDAHRRICPLLAPSSRRWAPDASLLVVNICHRYVEGTDWDSSEFAEYDLGQAVAHMTFQADALDLHSRQFRAFDREALEKELGLPEHWVAMTITAFGRPAQATPPHGRERRTLPDVLWMPSSPPAGSEA